MSDASGNGNGSSVLPAIGFLSLPNELLVKIARDLAPNGGRKAGSLRLVCRHLGRVAAPVTWASIVLPADADALDEIGAELMNLDGITSKIVSVRFNNPVSYSRMIVKALKKLPPAYHTRRLHLSIPEFSDPETIINTLKIALHANRLAEEIELDGDVSVPGRYMDTANDRIMHSTTLTLSGATRLFMAAPLNDPACPTIVKLLNWIGRGPLVTLSLPVFRPFFAHNALAALVLPRVQTLVLDVDPNSLSSTDLLSLDKYTHLIRFLKLASLPSLSTLHLRGWIDTTGVKGLASIPSDSLPDEAPLVFSLLGSLRKTTVVELRLENSREHAESDVQCIFSREGSGEWSSRLARFW
ncbi:hypothetical protein RQP46_007110 [Phenoliferia psychrophenolica]